MYYKILNRSTWFLLVHKSLSTATGTTKYTTITMTTTMSTTTMMTTTTTVLLLLLLRITPSCIWDPACNLLPASVSTTSRSVSGIQYSFGTWLQFEVLGYIGV